MRAPPAPAGGSKAPVPLSGTSYTRVSWPHAAPSTPLAAGSRPRPTNISPPRAPDWRPLLKGRRVSLTPSPLISPLPWSADAVTPRGRPHYQPAPLTGSPSAGWRQGAQMPRPPVGDKVCVGGRSQRTCQGPGPGWPCKSPREPGDTLRDVGPREASANTTPACGSLPGSALTRP